MGSPDLPGSSGRSLPAQGKETHLPTCCHCPRMSPAPVQSSWSGSGASLVPGTVETVATVAVTGGGGEKRECL